MEYRCEGPNCDYITYDSHQIHKHHVIPREEGGSNSRVNLIRLCPNCHNKVYIPTAKKGIHAIKAQNYMILKGIHTSTQGLVLEYEDSNTEQSYIELDTWRQTYVDKIKLFGE